MTIVLAGTSLVIPLPVPTIAFSLTVRPPQSVALDPREAPRFTTVGSHAQSASFCTLPSAVVACGNLLLMASVRRGGAHLGEPVERNATTLYRTLSPRANSELQSLLTLSPAMGLQLAVQPLKSTPVPWVSLRPSSEAMRSRRPPGHPLTGRMPIWRARYRTPRFSSRRCRPPASSRFSLATSGLHLWAEPPRPRSPTATD
jgi:hypothetical protein